MKPTYMGSLRILFYIVPISFSIIDSSERKCAASREDDLENGISRINAVFVCICEVKYVSIAICTVYVYKRHSGLYGHYTVFAVLCQQ